MIPIADILGMMAMTFFLIATIKQWHKIHITHNMKAISVTHYKLKVIAILCSLGCFALTNLRLSFVVVSVELVVTILILRLLIKYKK